MTLGLCYVPVLFYMYIFITTVIITDIFLSVLRAFFVSCIYIYTPGFCYGCFFFSLFYFLHFACSRWAWRGMGWMNDDMALDGMASKGRWRGGGAGARRRPGGR